MVNIEEAAIIARNRIGDFCQNECGAYCCRKGILLLTPIEKETTAPKLPLSLVNEKYVLDLGTGCPRLKGSSCSIHKDEHRSQTCKDFPLFIKEHNILLSQRCPAVKAGLFYWFEDHCLKNGYTYVKGRLQKTI